MKAKGRGIGGEKNVHAKLRAADLPVIKELYEQGLTQREIGKRYGVTDVTISYALSGRTWK